MVDLDQFATVAGLAVLIALILTVFFPQETGKTDNRRLPYVALGVGVLLSVAIGWATEGIKTPRDCVAWVIGGVLAGFTAIGYNQASRFGRRNGQGAKNVNGGDSQNGRPGAVRDN